MSSPMSRQTLFSIPLLLMLTILPANGAKQPAKSPESSSPVILELFTSQGCSSCPPADRLLTRLAEDPALAGRVIPLSFHVDYWDYIGWRDPFASPRWSERQREYGRAFRSNRIYTPQIVVNGRTECVGSHENVVRKQIAAALGTPPAARVSLEAGRPGADGRLKVRVGAELVRAAADQDLDLWVAVWETGLVTPVGAGENASHTLKNDHVVRRLEKALSLPGRSGSRESAEIVLGLDKRWKLENLGVAAFLQDPATRVIHGAAARRL
jgi:hypothetical protein